MPVEECGNLLIVCTVICKLDGNPQFAERCALLPAGPSIWQQKDSIRKVSFAPMILPGPWPITAICR